MDQQTLHIDWRLVGILNDLEMYSQKEVVVPQNPNETVC